MRTHHQARTRARSDPRQQAHGRHLGVVGGRLGARRDRWRCSASQQTWWPSPTDLAAAILGRCAMHCVTRVSTPTWCRQLKSGRLSTPTCMHRGGAGLITSRRPERSWPGGSSVSRNVYRNSLRRRSAAAAPRLTAWTRRGLAGRRVRPCGRPRWPKSATSSTDQDIPPRPGQPQQPTLFPLRR